MRSRVERHLAAIALVFVATVANAQERGFVGLSAFTARDDRRDTGPTRSPFAWSIDGGIFVTDRIAFGAEFFKPGDVQNLSSLRSVTTETVRDEKALMATVRTRIDRQERLALDAVAGIGGVQEVTTVTSTLNPFGTVPSVTTRSDRASWLALLAAVEVRVIVRAHLHVTPMAGVYYFDRPDTRSKVRPVAGVRLRATW